MDDLSNYLPSGHAALALMLFAALALAIVVLLLIARRFGISAALGVAVLCGPGLFALQHHRDSSERQRREADAQMDRAYALGCAQTRREILEPARGDERVYLRLHGVEAVPPSERGGLLPSGPRPTEGVEVVEQLPPPATQAIVVDFHYRREQVPGSIRGDERHRIGYDVSVRTVPGDRLIARTSDLQTRFEFCLGDLELFLRTALRRSAVLWDGSINAVRGGPATLPDAYVQAVYAPATAGDYRLRQVPFDPLPEVQAHWRARGCRAGADASSITEATCGDPSSGGAVVPLSGFIGLHALADSTLFVHRHTSSQLLSSLRIDQRGADGRLLRRWVAHAAPREDDFDAERVGAITIDGERMRIELYFDPRPASGNDARYAAKAVLTVPLPGLSR